VPSLCHRNRDRVCHFNISTSHLATPQGTSPLQSIGHLNLDRVDNIQNKAEVVWLSKIFPLQLICQRELQRRLATQCLRPLIMLSRYTCPVGRMWRSTVMIRGRLLRLSTVPILEWNRIEISLK